MSAGRGTGTAIPGHAATFPPRTTPSASTRSWRRSGRGRRSTPRSRRSWTTSGSWPTATGYALTSSSLPPSPRLAGTSRRNGGRSRPTAGGRCGAGTTSWPRAACRCPNRPTSTAPGGSPGRSTSPAAGRTRALTSPASGSRSSALARRASSPSRSSPARPASSRSSSAPRTSPSRRTTARPRPTGWRSWTGTATRTAMMPGGPGAAFPSSRPTCSPAPPARRSGGSASRRPGSRESCSAFSTSSPTRA